MNLPRHFLYFLLAAAAVASARAQNGAAPPAATVPVQSAQNWIASTDLQWQAVFKRDVTDLYESEAGKVKRQYAAAIQAGITKAGAAGDLDAALALRNEQKRFSDSNEIPPEDEAADAPSVKQMRAAFAPNWRAWRRTAPRAPRPFRSSMTTCSPRPRCSSRSASASTMHSS